MRAKGGERAAGRTRKVEAEWKIETHMYSRLQNRLPLTNTLQFSELLSPNGLT